MPLTNPFSSALSVGFGLELPGRGEVAEFRVFGISSGFASLRSVVSADAQFKRGAACEVAAPRRRAGDRAQRKGCRGQMVHR